MIALKSLFLMWDLSWIVVAGRRQQQLSTSSWISSSVSSGLKRYGRPSNLNNLPIKSYFSYPAMSLGVSSRSSSLFCFVFTRVTYCLPVTTIHAVAHVTFPAFDFRIVSYMRLLFEHQGRYCFSLTTKQLIICAFAWNKALGAVHH